MEKRAAIKKYFKSFPKWAVWMIVIGIPMLGAKGAGIILIGIGGWVLFDWSKKPSDSQMDVWLEEDLAALQIKSLSKSGTDQSELVGESVVVTGPRFWNISNAEFAFKKGKDNVARYTPTEVSVINFTADQLLIYTCVLDSITGNPLNESTDEYFYRDVVSVSTKTKSLNVDIKGQGALQLNSAETFELTTSGGTSIEVVLRAPNLTEMMGGGDVPTTKAEKAIQTVRKMLRERKGTAVAA